MFKNSWKYPSVILGIVMFLTIGYSAFSHQLNIDDIIAYYRAEADIRITNISIENAINAMVTDGVSGVWICTNQRLMHVTFPTRIITKYDIAPSLLNGNIRTLCRI